MRPAPLMLLLPLLASTLCAAEERPGKIVYSRMEGERALLHVMNADGSGDALLPGQTATLNLFPTWSPDGKRIAFMTCGRHMPLQVSVINADGSGLTVLNTPARIAGLPAWSPDGKQLAFASGDEAPSVYVADPSGNGARQVNPGGSSGIFPFWSKDGKAVGYTRIKPGEEAGEIVLAKLAGGEEVLTQAGKLAVAGANALSPDGKRLLYVVIDRAEKSGSLRLLDLATKVENTLAPLDLAYAGEFFLAPTPAWSPDGKGILIAIAGEKGRALCRLSDDGKSRTRLTPEGIDCLQAAWR
jgi:Tol biopolymer transport system component